MNGTILSRRRSSATRNRTERPPTTTINRYCAPCLLPRAPRALVIWPLTRTSRGDVAVLQSPVHRFDSGRRLQLVVPAHVRCTGAFAPRRGNGTSALFRARWGATHLP